MAGFLSKLLQGGQEKVRDMAQALVPPLCSSSPSPTCWVSLAGICWKRSQAFQKVTFSALNSFFRNSWRGGGGSQRHRDPVRRCGQELG